MAEDPKEYAANLRFAELLAAEKQVDANFAQFELEAYPDIEVVKQNVQVWSNIQQEKNALQAAYADYQARKHPVAPPPLSPEQEAARPIENWGDTWNQISKTAKSQRELEAMAVKFREGMDYVNKHPTRRG